MKQKGDLPVGKIAHLSRLSLTPLESVLITKQLEETLNSLQVLDELDTSKIGNTFEVTGRVNVVRKDIVTKSLTQKEALQNAKKTHNGYFVVPGVFNLNNEETK